MKHKGPALLLAVLLANGCRVSEPAPTAAPAAALGADPSAAVAPARPLEMVDMLARCHWLGKSRIAADTNASTLVGLWDLPEGRRLEAHALDRLALAPWRLLELEPDTNTAAVFRPLLDDLLGQESYLEICQATNQPGQIAFAIRLNDSRAALWQNNLARVLQSLTGIQPVAAPGDPPGWSLRKHDAPNLIQMARLNGWTIIGAAHERNRLWEDMVTRTRYTQLPYSPPVTNCWVTVAIDPVRVANAFSLSSRLSDNFPRISFDVVGDRTNVWTYGDLVFPRPVSIALEPWNVPTNFIDKMLVSFTAIRGFGPWLSSQNAWNDLMVGPPPNQFFVWALQGLQMETYFAAPMRNPSDTVSRLTDVVIDRGAAFFATNELAKFKRSEAFKGLEWQGLPYVYPYLMSVTNRGGEFAFGGLFPSVEPDPVSPDLVRQALSRTNLVYHDWELTGPRVEQWIYIGQFGRYVSRHAQLPFDSPVLYWLRAAAPKLGASLTEVTLTAPGQLSFNRSSTVGLTAFELQLLVDWLESPRFPMGLHTFDAPPDKLPEGL